MTRAGPLRWRTGAGWLVLAGGGKWQQGETGEIENLMVQERKVLFEHVIEYVGIEFESDRVFFRDRIRFRGRLSLILFLGQQAEQTNRFPRTHRGAFRVLPTHYPHPTSFPDDMKDPDPLASAEER